MTQERENKRQVFISLRVKLLIAFTLLFSLVFAAAFYWFLTYATDAALQRVEDDMVTTLNAAVNGVDGDTFQAISQEGGTDDPRYTEHVAWIETVHNIEPRAFIYTYIAGETENEILFIGDTLSFVRPDDAAAFRESYISDGPLIDGLSELTLNLTPYSDDWGQWVSAYAPITNADGEKIGGVGIDFEAAYVAQVRQGVLDNILIAFAGTYAALFIMVFLVSRAFTQPISDLTQIAERIGEGQYDQDLSGIGSQRFPDEIRILANVFEIMLSKVRTREESLKQEVTQLRIVLDERKRNEQVNQIVESDFFRDLREKARVMRERRDDYEAEESESTAENTSH